MSKLVELPLDSYPKQLSVRLTDAGGYSFATACAMAWLSQLAYETEDPHNIDKIDTVLKGGG